MDLTKIKERLQAAKRTSESKHYKIAISELVGVLIDLVDEIQAGNPRVTLKKTKEDPPVVYRKPPAEVSDGVRKTVEVPPPNRFPSNKDVG